MKYEFTIPGKPIPKARPRVYKRGKFVKGYNSQEKAEGEFALNAFESSIKVAGKKLSGPVFLDIIFHLKRPKSHYGTGKNSETLKKNAPKFHVSKPDVDNLVKFVMDSLNKVTWYDDSQVFQVIGRKEYSETEETVLKIIEVEND